MASILQPTTPPLSESLSGMAGNTQKPVVVQKPTCPHGHTCGQSCLHHDHTPDGRPMPTNELKAAASETNVGITDMAINVAVAAESRKTGDAIHKKEDIAATSPPAAGDSNSTTPPVTKLEPPGHQKLDKPSTLGTDVGDTSAYHTTKEKPILSTEKAPIKKVSGPDTECAIGEKGDVKSGASSTTVDKGDGDMRDSAGDFVESVTPKVHAESVHPKVHTEVNLDKHPHPMSQKDAIIGEITAEEVLALKTKSVKQQAKPITLTESKPDRHVPMPDEKKLDPKSNSLNLDTKALIPETEILLTPEMDFLMLDKKSLMDDDRHMRDSKLDEEMDELDYEMDDELDDEVDDELDDDVTDLVLDKEGNKVDNTLTAEDLQTLLPHKYPLTPEMTFPTEELSPPEKQFIPIETPSTTSKLPQEDSDAIPEKETLPSEKEFSPSGIEKEGPSVERKASLPDPRIRDSLLKTTVSATALLSTTGPETVSRDTGGSGEQHYPAVQDEMTDDGEEAFDVPEVLDDSFADDPIPLINFDENRTSSPIDTYSDDSMPRLETDSTGGRGMATEGVDSKKREAEDQFGIKYLMGESSSSSQMMAESSSHRKHGQSGEDIFVLPEDHVLLTMTDESELKADVRAADQPTSESSFESFNQSQDTSVGLDLSSLDDSTFESIPDDFCSPTGTDPELMHTPDSEPPSDEKPLNLSTEEKRFQQNLSPSSSPRRKEEPSPPPVSPSDLFS